MITKQLSEIRKKDRETMAQMVEKLADTHGWKHERCSYAPTADGVRVNLLGPEGLAVGVEFERYSGQTDNYCLPWHFDFSARDSDVRLSEAFGRYQGSTVNPCHGRKCTAFARGIATLLDKLQVAMEMAAGTSAFGSAFTTAKGR